MPRYAIKVGRLTWLLPSLVCWSRSVITRVVIDTPTADRDCVPAETIELD